MLPGSSTMFFELAPAVPDPILGLMAAFSADPRPHKIDLGVGVYKDEAGHTPVLAAVKRAEALRLEREASKTYIGMAGDPGFNRSLERLALGEVPALAHGRVATAHTPGGTGALRVAAELIRRARPEATLWVPDPTWGNHPTVFKAAGLKVREYAYYDGATQSLRADAMLAALAEVPAHDVVLLHACCHNPSGVDLEPAHWAAVAELAEKRGFLCFVDMAYQGFAEGLDLDAYGPRLLAERLPELLLATSCSKNFGLYRERIGALSVVGSSAAHTEATFSVLLSAIRNVYSMPPAHGAVVVREILADDELRALWLAELATMRERINHYRGLLVQRLRQAGIERDFGFIERQRGMFSFLGISAEQVERLKTEHAIYMVGSSRMNIAGLSAANIDHFVASLKSVL
jgi:aspartate aminotransferase